MSRSVFIMSKHYPNADWPISEHKYLVLIDGKYEVLLEVEDHSNPKSYFFGPILEEVIGKYPIKVLSKIKEMLMHGSLYHELEELHCKESENTVPYILSLNVDTWTPPPPPRTYTWDEIMTEEGI